MVYEKEDILAVSRCGADACVSIIGAAEIIEDHLCAYFKTLDIDQIKLKSEFNTFWMIVRNKIKILKTIPWNSQIGVKCAISDVTLAKMVVEVAIYYQKELAIYSNIEICMLDLATQKVRKIKEVLSSDFQIQPKTIQMDFERFNENGVSKLAEFKVNSTNIDYCHHTNNIEYIRIALTAYNFKELLEKPITGFEINYINQAYEGDILEIYGKKCSKYDYLELMDANKTTIKCKIVRKSR